jgi:hypothetical protein
MGMTREQVRQRLCVLATQVARMDEGRAASRLSAYALRICERSEQRTDICADLDALADRTSHPLVAEMLHEAPNIVRDMREQ